MKLIELLEDNRVNEEMPWTPALKRRKLNKKYESKWRGLWKLTIAEIKKRLSVPRKASIMNDVARRKMNQLLLDKKAFQQFTMKSVTEDNAYQVFKSLSEDKQTHTVNVVENRVKNILERINKNPKNTDFILTKKKELTEKYLPILNESFTNETLDSIIDEHMKSTSSTNPKYRMEIQAGYTDEGKEIYMYMSDHLPIDDMHSNRINKNSEILLFDNYDDLTNLASLIRLTFSGDGKNFDDPDDFLVRQVNSISDELAEDFHIDPQTAESFVDFDPETVTAEEFKKMGHSILDRHGNDPVFVNGKEFNDAKKAVVYMKSLVQHRIDAKKKEQDALEKKWAPHRWDHPDQPYANKAEMVPIWWLKRLKGNDLRLHGDTAQNVGYNPDTKDWEYGDLEALAKSIKERGIQEPVMISVGLDGYAYIGEGNHRIEAAEMAGLKELPTRVWMSNKLGDGTRGKGQYTHDVRKDITWDPSALESYPKEKYFQKPSQVFKSLGKLEGSYVNESLNEYKMMQTPMVDLYENPNASDIKGLLTKFKTLRGMKDGDKIFVWDATLAAHHQVAEQLTKLGYSAFDRGYDFVISIDQEEMYISEWWDDLHEIQPGLWVGVAPLATRRTVDPHEVIQSDDLFARMFNRSLTEAVEKVSRHDGFEIPVLVNPNARILRTFLNRSEYNELRGLYDGDNFFFWDAEHLIHGQMAPLLGIHYDEHARLDVTERGDGEIIIDHSEENHNEYKESPWIASNVDVEDHGYEDFVLREDDQNYLKTKREQYLQKINELDQSKYSETELLDVRNEILEVHNQMSGGEIFVEDFEDDQLNDILSQYKSVTNPKYAVTIFYVIGQSGEQIEVTVEPFKENYHTMPSGLKNKKQIAALYLDNINDVKDLATLIKTSTSYNFKLVDNNQLLEAKGDKEKLELPSLEKGDILLVGKFKNRKATIKGFDTEEKTGQPLAKTDKGVHQIFKGRVKKLMPDKEEKTLKKVKERYNKSIKHAQNNLHPTIAEEQLRTIKDYSLLIERAERGLLTEKFKIEDIDDFIKSSYSDNITNDDLIDNETYHAVHLSTGLDFLDDGTIAMNIAYSFEQLSGKEIKIIGVYDTDKQDPYAVLYFDRLEDSKEFVTNLKLTFDNVSYSDDGEKRVYQVREY